VKDPDPALPIRKVLHESKRKALDIEFPFRLHEPNICVLDRACHRMDDGEWQDPLEILKIDRKIRTALGLEFRSGRMLQPWFKKDGKENPLALVSLRFEFSVDDLPTEPVFLILEQPDQYTTLSINGHTLDPQRPMVGGWTNA